MKIDYLTQAQIKSLLELLEPHKDENKYKQIYLFLKIFEVA